MAQHILKPGDLAQSFDFTDVGGTFTVTSGSTVFYGSTQAVTSTVFDGSVAVGGTSPTLFGVQWLVVDRASIGLTRIEKTRGSSSSPVENEQRLTLVETSVAANTTAIGTKADDSAAVHKTGAETISGAKTFNGDILHGASGMVGLFGSGVNKRIPFAANPLIDGPTAIANGSSNLVGFALNPKLQGDFSGITGSDPGSWWGLNVFAILASDVAGITNATAGLHELDVTMTKGIVPVARGSQSQVAFYGAGAGAKITQAESMRVSAPTRKNGQTTFTANTTSGSNQLASVSSFTGLAVGNYVTGPGIPADTVIAPGGLNPGAGTITLSNNATATATGITVNLGTVQNAYTLLIEDVAGIGTGSNFSLFVAGGISRFGGRVDVTDNISNNGAGGDLSIYSGFSDADGARLQLIKAAGSGHFRARMATTNAEFQVHDGSATNWSVSRTGLPKWNLAGNQQTTVGAAGGGSALPATPVKYLKVVDSTGATLVIPAYNP